MSRAIYAIEDARQWGPHVALALRALRQRFDVVIVAGDIAPLAGVLAGLGKADAPDRAIAAQGLAGAFRAGLTVPGGGGPVLLTGAHAIGPIPGRLQPQDCPPDAVLAAYPVYDLPEHVARVRPTDEALPSLDFCVLGARIAARPDISSAFQGGPAPLMGPRRCEVSLARYLHRSKIGLGFCVARAVSSSPAPAWFEPALMLASGAPCLPAGLPGLDPLVQDASAIDLPAAIEGLRALAPELCAAWIAHARRTVPPRSLALRTAGYAVLPTEACAAPETGPVGVFIHAWYPEDIGHLADLIARIPAPIDLYVSTGTEASRQQIAAELAARGLVADIRLVAQNRGRDMSSLFITFADVLLSGRHDVALRLHSKRSPQLPPQVSSAFLAHLVTNLLASPGYVARILQRFADNPRLGLVMPPAVQRGLGTLGHGWFGNRAPLEKWARRLAIDVPLDPDTPLAPFGTMFWFRPNALAKLFAYPWRWRDYNAEPHHVDGGLAHVQERLIGYAALDAGYDILQVMTPEHAAQAYGGLEYKYQALAGLLSSPSVVDQRAELSGLVAAPSRRVHRRLEGGYRGLLARFPAASVALRPLARRISRLLVGRGAA